MLWLPLAEPAEPERQRGNFGVFGRLKHGVSVERIDSFLAGQLGRGGPISPFTPAWPLLHYGAYRGLRGEPETQETKRPGR